MDESRSEREEELKKEIEKEIEKEVEKEVTKGVTVGITILITVAVTFIISLLVLKLVWGWVIPDLFPGAVAQGLIVADLTWLSALKLAVLVAALSGVYPTLIGAFGRR